MGYIIVPGDVDAFLERYGTNAVLTPEEVRVLCDISSGPRLRYWSNEFIEFLHISYTERNHRRYISGDLPLIVRIRELCQEQHRDVAEAINVLVSEGYAHAVYEDEETDESLPQVNNELIKAMNGTLESFYESIESSEKRTKAHVREQSKQIQAEILSSRELLQQSNEVLNKQNELIEKQMKMLAEQQEKMQQMQEEISILKEQTKPKKKFWQRKRP